ncbi:MAG: hypothetical protein IPN42_16280 [Methylococcaceae bacterium]|nr:hypothetical protein [Methylococcaceae bacterium]
MGKSALQPWCESAHTTIQNNVTCFTTPANAYIKRTEINYSFPSNKPGLTGRGLHEFEQCGTNGNTAHCPLVIAPYGLKLTEESMTWLILPSRKY